MEEELEEVGEEEHEEVQEFAIVDARYESFSVRQTGQTPC